MVHSSRFFLVLLWTVSFFHVPVLADHDYGEELSNNKCKNLLQRREWYLPSFIDLSSSPVTDGSVAGESLITLKKPTTSKPSNVYNLVPLFTNI